MTAPLAEPARPDRRWGALPVALVLLAGLLRLLAARGDLWLDEVWSLELLAQLHSPLEIFTLRHDNNHLLNSLLLWFLRPFDGDLLLRLPAVLCGTASVALAAAVAARSGGPAEGPPRRRATFAALLVGTSYMMVHYGSEARGYGLLLGLALLALYAAVRGRLEPRSRWAFVYGAAGVLALLAHPLAVHLLLGVAAWSLLRWWRRGLRGGRLLAACTAWHAVPFAAAAALVVGFLRGMIIGGGPVEGVAPVLGRAVAYMMGMPTQLGSVALVGIGAGLLLGGVAWLAARGDDAWVFYLVAGAISPLVTQALQPGDLHFERYFVLSAALTLLLGARLLGALATRGRAGAALATLLVVAFCGAQVPRLVRLLRDGRGQYRAALQLMVDSDPAPRIYVSSDHDLRNWMMLQYYRSRVPGGARLVYVPRRAWATVRPAWQLFHRFEGEPAPAPVLTNRLGGQYRLVASFPSAPLSGWTWFVYRRTSTASGP